MARKNAREKARRRALADIIRERWELWLKLAAEKGKVS